MAISSRHLRWSACRAVCDNEVGRRVEQYVVQVDVTSVSVPELEAPLESNITAGPRV